MEKSKNEGMHVIPVSAMFAEYGLSILKSRESRHENATPGYPYEEELMYALRRAIDSIDELRILSTLWVAVTFPRRSYDGPTPDTVSEVLHIVFEPREAFSKNGIAKGLMERGIIITFARRGGMYGMRESSIPFINREVSLSPEFLDYISQLDHQPADTNDVQTDETDASLLTFSQKKKHTVNYENMELKQLTRMTSGIKLDDHYLESELQERIHMAAHGKNAEVRRMMTAIGVYSGPQKRDESDAVAERNVIILHGPPGTGKTSAAYAIAGELGVPMLLLNVDKIYSMWWGEAEQNIRAAFNEYREAARLLGRFPVLLMDECDSLMIKRAHVRAMSSHNGTSNVVNILLQEIETFRGTLVMTTNDIEHIDPAFARRVDDTIKIDYPSRRIQRAMWQRYLQVDIEGADTVDIDALLDAGNLTGALIVKCVEKTIKGLLLHDGPSPVITTDALLNAIRHELSSFDNSVHEQNRIGSMGFV